MDENAVTESRTPAEHGPECQRCKTLGRRGHTMSGLRERVETLRDQLTSEAAGTDDPDWSKTVGRFAASLSRILDADPVVSTADAQAHDAQVAAQVEAKVRRQAADDLREWRQANATNYHTSQGLLALERKWLNHG